MTCDVDERIAPDLIRAQELMAEALDLLDRQRHDAAPYLDLAIVRLGLRHEDC